jgi:hypothetical protein
MKRIISFFLVTALVFAPLLSYAASTEDNLRTAKEQTRDVLKELKTAKGTGANEYADESIYKEKGSAYSEYKTSGLGSDYYTKTAESPYTKSKIAEGIAAVATSAASAIGTSMQTSVISQLTAMISDLKGSNVPEYQTMATSLEKENAAIKVGDSITAKKTAEDIATYASTYMPVDQSYTPTASEREALNPFVEFFKGFLGSILQVLSKSAIAVLTAALSTIFGPIGAAIGGSLSSVVESIAGSLINNTPIDASNLGSAAAGDINSVISKKAGDTSTAIEASATPAATSVSSTAPLTQREGSNVEVQGSSTDTKMFNTK